MNGLHLTADLRGCTAATVGTTSAPASLSDVNALRTLCLDAVAGAGLSAVAEIFHRFPAPGGVTGVVLLAESHLALHTWPEHEAVTLDVYVCNVGADNSARAEHLMQLLRQSFAAQSVHLQRLQRGSVAD